MVKLAASNQFGISDQTDVFLVDREGTLRVAWVNGAGRWNGPVPISPPGLFPLGAAVAASNQFGLSDQTDVFGVDRNGALHVAWVNGAGGWNGPAPISPPGLFPPGAAIAASNQFGLSDQTDVFVVGSNGALHVAWVNGAGGWNGPAPISPPGLFPPGAAVSASNQFGLSDQTDVFVVGSNGALHVAWVNGAGGWNGPAPISPPGFFPPGAVVAVSNQFGLSDQTDVFVVGSNGALHVAWVNGAGGWNGPAPISPAGLFPPGAVVAASNQFGLSDQTDVIVIDGNGALHVAWVNGGGGWNGPAPISPPGLFPPGAAVAASNQFGLSDQTDVFAVDGNGTLHVAWVNGAGGWNGPAPIVPRLLPTITLRPVADEGRFIEVTGNGFTSGGTVQLSYDIFSGSGPTTHQTGQKTLTSNGTGNFLDRIPVILGEVSGAQVEATDTASGATADGSI
nr:hypothetical protein [Burkholderia ubonensis]